MDPLAQLKDIHLPEQVSNYPIAPGWWLLLVITLVALFYLVRFIKNYRAIRYTKKQILSALAQSTSFENSSQLLKLALVHYFPRQDTAALYGDKLNAFLHDTLPESKQAEFERLMPDNLTSMYQLNSDLNLAEFNQATRFWLSHALPPKQINKSEGNT